MKKVILFAVVALAIVSCGPKKADQTVAPQDSIAKVDSVNTDSTKVDSTAIKADSVAVKK